LGENWRIPINISDSTGAAREPAMPEIICSPPDAAHPKELHGLCQGNAEGCLSAKRREVKKPQHG
ncbi:hypothetical protein VU05_03475, partial [Desulfobulbus sp. F1]|nr:hypothetical protein [Desulfobulbus sp. F1]